MVFELSPRRWEAAAPHRVGRSFIICPFPLMGTTKPMRGTIELALFLPIARPTFWGTPNNPRLRKKLGAVG